MFVCAVVAAAESNHTLDASVTRALRCVLQWVAVCCNVFFCVCCVVIAAESDDTLHASGKRVLQCVAACSSVLQCVLPCVCYSGWT